MYWSWAVAKMITVAGSVSWMSLAHSTPLILGISTSKKTTWGRCFSTSSMSVSPSSASPTREKPSTLAIIWRITVRMPASSSAIKTWMSFNGRPTAFSCPGGG
jgi:hypothetical protein